MPTIKGFTTKKPIAPQLKKAGVKSVKLPFSTEGDFKCSKNPLEGKGVEIVGCDKKPLKIKKL